MIKPDGVQRRLVGNIIGRFEQRGFTLRKLMLLQPSKQLLESHYQHLRDKSFFPQLLSFMSSGPVVAMVWEGAHIVDIARTMLGCTNAAQAAPGTIRGDFATETSFNVCHGSDSITSAQREIKLWFGDH